MDDFGIKLPTKVDMPLNKETKTLIWVMVFLSYGMHVYSSRLCNGQRPRSTDPYYIRFHWISRNSGLVPNYAQPSKWLPVMLVNRMQKFQLL